ncbi:MAG: thiazole synthase [Commensalibacter sp.]
MTDPVTFYDVPVQSRLLLGTARYPTPEILKESITQSQAEIITVSLRRESATKRHGQGFWGMIQQMGKHILPNTAGCHSVKEAVTTAHMAREVFQTDWIKLELIGDNDTLQPDVFGLVEAAKILCAEGFKVFPYTTDDLIVAERLLAVGCCVLMPWGAPIGSGRGLNDPYSLRTMRAYFPNIPLVVDAGIGLPSHAAQAMELGYDAILLNTAVAKSGDPIVMATAFAKAIEAGRQAYLANPMEMLDMAAPSTPVIGKAFDV